MHYCTFANVSLPLLTDIISLESLKLTGGTLPAKHFDAEQHVTL